MKPYATDSCQYIASTNAVACVTVTDFQPFSIVEDKGYKFVLNAMDLYKVSSCKYFSEKVIPNMYEELRGKVKVCIDYAIFLALTMDYWTFHAIDSRSG